MVAMTDDGHGSFGHAGGCRRQLVVRPPVSPCAALAAAGGRRPRAVRLFAAAQSLRERHGYAGLPPTLDQHEADLAAAREGLGAAELAAAWAEGAEMTLEAAVAYAAGERRRPARAVAGWEALTPAERQVAELVAEGLTNRQIAERLVVCPRTVHSHLRRIFAKLGVTNRAALTREAHRR
jgi:DNA-binding CsgD family transcriptional regulator